MRARDFIRYLWCNSFASNCQRITVLTFRESEDGYYVTLEKKKKKHIHMYILLYVLCMYVFRVYIWIQTVEKRREVHTKIVIGRPTKIMIDRAIKFRCRAGQRGEGAEGAEAPAHAVLGLREHHGAPLVTIAGNEPTSQT